MDVGLRDRRLRNEWKILQELKDAHPTTLEVLDYQSDEEGDLFRIVLHQTGGIIQLDGQKLLLRSHDAEIRFPRFFPSMPIEAKLLRPVLHPNVNPCNGFVCLWDRSSPGDTVTEAIRQLQQIISWKSVNVEANHVMQPEAVDWYRNPARGWDLPLEFIPIVASEFSLLPSSFAANTSPRNRRRLYR